MESQIKQDTGYGFTLKKKEKSSSSFQLKVISVPDRRILYTARPCRRGNLTQRVYKNKNKKKKKKTPPPKSEYDRDTIHSRCV